MGSYTCAYVLRTTQPHGGKETVPLMSRWSEKHSNLRAKLRTDRPTLLDTRSRNPSTYGEPVHRKRDRPSGWVDNGEDKHLRHSYTVAAGGEGLGGGCAGQLMEIVHWAEPGWVPRTAQGRQNLSLWGDEPRPGMQKKILECWCRGVETIAVPGVRAGSRHTLFASSALWSLISPRASFSEHSQAEDLAQHLMEVASPP